MDVPKNKRLSLKAGKNECKQIFPPANENRIALDYRISLSEYLQGYGINMTNATRVNSLTQPTLVTETFLNGNFSTNTAIRTLRAFVEANNPAQVPLHKLPTNLTTLPLLLQQIGFVPSNPRLLNRMELNYLLGQWLEEYVYTTIQTLFNLDNRFIGNSVNIQRQQVPNELDVVLIYHNTIYVIECKTGLTKPIFDQTVYKLNALRKEFGLFVKSAIVYLNNYRQSTLRADLFGINLFGEQITKNKSLFKTELINFIK